MKMISKITLARISGAGVGLLPIAALATAVGGGPSVDTTFFQDAITQVATVLNMLVPFLIGLAVVLFLIGVVRYVTAGEDPEKRKNGRNLMIWGIIAIFVMVAVWGLVAILENLVGTPGVTTPSTPDLPTIPAGGAGGP